jgi:hypothetical protein
MPTEATIKGDLVKKLRKRLPWAITLRHEDRFTAGVPDISITNGKYRSTLWLEVKFDIELSEIGGLQKHTLMRLGGFYVLYDQDRHVYILDPREKDVVMTGVGHDVVVAFAKKMLTF